MKRGVFLSLFLLVTPALAEPRMSPSQLAIGIDNDVGLLAQLAEHQAIAIQALQAALTVVCAHIKDEKPKECPVGPADQPR